MKLFRSGGTTAPTLEELIAVRDELAAQLDDAEDAEERAAQRSRLQELQRAADEFTLSSAEFLELQSLERVLAYSARASAERRTHLGDQIREVRSHIEVAAFRRYLEGAEHERAAALAAIEAAEATLARLEAARATLEAEVGERVIDPALAHASRGLDRARCALAIPAVTDGSAVSTAIARLRKPAPAAVPPRYQRPRPVLSDVVVRAEERRYPMPPVISR